MKFLANISLLIFLLFYAPSFAQPISIGDLEINYENPRQYEIGPIQVIGAENFDHQAIKLIAGLKQGQTISVPGIQIAQAIKNLWNEGLFSDVEIIADKEVAGVITSLLSWVHAPNYHATNLTG